MRTIKASQACVVLMASGILASCATNNIEKKVQEFEVPKSYLMKKTGVEVNELELAEQGNGQSSARKHVDVPSLFNEEASLSNDLDLADNFSEAQMVKLASNELPFNDFLHYIFGEVLKVNYVIEGGAKSDINPITLNISDELSSKRVFVLLEDLLSKRNYRIVFRNSVYFIIPNDAAGNANVVFGVGGNVNDVPQTTRDIMQVVPFKFGFQSNLSLLLGQVAGVQVTPDAGKNLLYIWGKRENIVRALEFMQIVDQPGGNAENITLLNFTFISPSDFIVEGAKLLSGEGLSVAVDRGEGVNVILIPLDTIGSVAVFASERNYLERAKYWAKQLDKPDNSEVKNYFVYQPKYARATDLGESLDRLLSGFNKLLSQENEPRAANSLNNRAVTPGNDDISVVVDERSNSLIVFATGIEYQKIMGLIQRLDVTPKQILLDMVIAEVTLTDDFKKGVEFALNKGRYNIGTAGSFGEGDMGGLSYSLTSGLDTVDISLFQDNTLVNVLSRPTLLVRDGVSASINVGNDIPVIGSTTVDPVSGTRETTSIQYRKTGLQLNVTPTVNSQGVVIMEIEQQISNTPEGAPSATGSPIIFERSISTEVVADSGQTIILGGLISENGNIGSSKVPLLGDIPGVGHLFRGDTETVEKTELVVLVTPRIINRQDEWVDIKNKFMQTLSNVSLDGALND